MIACLVGPASSFRAMSDPRMAVYSLTNLTIDANAAIATNIRTIPVNVMLIRVSICKSKSDMAPVNTNVAANNKILSGYLKTVFSNW